MYKSLFLAVAVLLSSSVFAATYTYTEGARPEVFGTDYNLSGDAPNNGGIYNLVDLGFGASEYDTINLHGRIVSKEDNFEFKSSSAFRIDFIFGGYFLDDAGSQGAFVSESGFVDHNSAGNQSVFTLFSSPTGSESKTFTTDVTSGPSLIFSALAGTYMLRIDGGALNPKKAALYDIRISAIPIPAAVWLFGSGLIGLISFSRRNKANS